MLVHFARATIQGYHSIRKINGILVQDHFWVGIISGTGQFSLNIQINSLLISTQDNYQPNFECFVSTAELFASATSSYSITST